MSHEPQHNQHLEDEGDALTGLHSSDIAWVGAITTVLVIVIMVATKAWFHTLDRNNTANQYLDIEKEGLPASPSAKYTLEQEATLDLPSRWVDEENSLVAIPIETAMDLLVERGLTSE